MNHEPAAEIGRSVLIWNLIEILPQLGRKDGQDRKATLHHQRGKRVSVQYNNMYNTYPYSHTAILRLRQTDSGRSLKTGGVPGGEKIKKQPCFGHVASYSTVHRCFSSFSTVLDRSWILILSFLLRMEWMYVRRYVCRYVHTYICTWVTGCLNFDGTVALCGSLLQSCYPLGDMAIWSWLFSANRVTVTDVYEP